MATTVTIQVTGDFGLPTSPLTGRFDATANRYLAHEEDGDVCMTDEEQKQTTLTVGTIIDGLFSAPSTPGAATPGANTPIRLEFPAALQHELKRVKDDQDAFHSGLSTEGNFSDSTDIEMEDSDDNSSSYGSSSAVFTVPSTPAFFDSNKAGALRVLTDAPMTNSVEYPDTPIVDVSGFGTVVPVNGSLFSAQDAYHLRNLLHAARNLTNPTIAKFLHAVFEQEQWCQLEISNRTTPYLVLANYEAAREGGDMELANGLRAFHRLTMAKPTPEAMAKAIRQVRGCPSAADVDQMFSVDVANMPLTDVRQKLYSLLMESSGVDYSNAPLSPSLESGMSLIVSEQIESSEYQYQEGCFHSEDYFQANLGRDNLNREDAKTTILAWLMLAQLTFSTQSWTATFSQHLSQSPAYVEARAAVLAEMYQASEDMVSQDLILQSIDFKVLWANWVGEQIPAPWMGMSMEH